MCIVPKKSHRCTDEAHAEDRQFPASGERNNLKILAEQGVAVQVGESCERERLPLIIELDIDGETVFSKQAEPSGLWNDGPSSVYERLNVSAGAHEISVRMRDTARTEGWDYTKSAEVVLEPGRYFTVTFKAATGGFNFR